MDSLIVDNFFVGAKSLRKTFDSKMGTVKTASPSRFVWDYWHVPGQYSHLRTPAEKFFDETLIDKFEQHLLNYGKKHLGCVGITPIWLSCYINGSKQGWHADVPHGPFAYVFSLTNLQAKKFTGGETCIFKDAAINFWPNFHGKNGIEEAELIEKIPPRFNRLIVFDPRRPHCVSEVHGSQDPLEGRLVMHGWFTHPQPFVEGGLAKVARFNLDDLYAEVLPSLNKFRHLHGMICFRVRIGRDGRVLKVAPLISTLQSMDSAAPAALELQRQVRKIIATFRFPKTNTASLLSFPLVFF